MSLLKDIPGLVEAGIITQETADNIRDYYKQKRGSSSNLLFIAFGILGATLVGLGVILVIAHNWDELTRGTKTFFAFLPLVTGQVLCGYILAKKRNNVAWKEGGTTFLFFAIGASLSLVSQIYNIAGSLSSFLLTWILLGLPLVYVMRSSVASLLCIVGVTFYAVEEGYWSYSYSQQPSYLHWPLYFALLPHYFLLYKRQPGSNFMYIHNWFIPLALIIALGTVAQEMDEFMFIAYSSLFGSLYLFGNSNLFTGQKPRGNGARVLGLLGILVLLLILSFDDFWEELRLARFQFDKVIVSPEFVAAATTSLLAGTLYYVQHRHLAITKVKPLAPMFALFILIFILGMYSPIAVVLINLYVFVVGILTIREGALQDHFGVLNFGLLIITALVICRFFDTDLDFVIRGVMFVVVGVGFFIANYRMLRKRKENGS